MNIVFIRKNIYCFYFRNSLTHIDVESIEVGASRARSTPVNMPSIPNTSTTSRPLVPVLIESGSCSKLKIFKLDSKISSRKFLMQILGSHEQSPRLLDSFHYESTDSDVVIGPDSQLKEDLADAMRDCATIPINRETGEL